MPTALLHRTARILLNRPRLRFLTQRKRVESINRASLIISMHHRFHILPRGTPKARLRHFHTRILTWILSRYLVVMGQSKQNNLVALKPVADQVTNKIGKPRAPRQNRWKRTSLGRLANKNFRTRLTSLPTKTR
jgi:hypothetical protein